MNPSHPFHTTLFDDYQQRIRRFTERWQKVRKRRNLLTASKLLLFGAMVWMVVRIVQGEVLSSLIALGAMVVAFALLSRWDSRIVQELALLRALQDTSQLETEYLQGNFSRLDPGEDLSDLGHAYAHDLDLFGDESLFQAVNRTVTSLGRSLLARWLLTPCKEWSEIQERQEAAQELSERTEWCHLFRAQGTVHAATGADNSLIEEWRQQRPFFRRSGTMKAVYLLNILNALAWGGFLMDVVPYVIPLLLTVVQLLSVTCLMMRINALHNRLDHFTKAMGSYYHLVKLIDTQKFSSPRLQQLKSSLQTPSDASVALNELHRILGGFDQRNNVLAFIALNALYMRDLHVISRLERWKSRHGAEIVRWIEVIAEVDALVSMANYRVNHPEFVAPEFSDEVLIDGEGLGHPLLRASGKVRNDFRVESLHRLYIVTGANMAGKSTFLRTVGVNLVLAFSGNVVCSSRFRCQPMGLFTSMRTTDNLAKGTSYFHAELLRLKQMVDQASEGGPLWVILDEMLKGTNSQDKLKGSIAFMTRLLELPLSGILATHDLAMGDLAEQYPQNFRNLCFEIEHEPSGEIRYDYKLRPGVSQNMNASILLKQMGLI